MKNLEVKHFKNEMSDYCYLESKLKRIEEMQLELDTKRGLHAIRYDKEAVQGGPDPLTVELRRLDDIEKSTYLENTHAMFKSRLDYIDNFINGSEIGDSIKKIHCLSTSTYDLEAKKLFVGTKTLKRRVNREIIKYLSE